MMRWIPAEIERIVGREFNVPEQSDPFRSHEVLFEAGGLRYCLNVCPVSEQVWLRADAQNPNQATPHFEFSFRCDRVRTGDGDYDSEAIWFEYSKGDEEVDFHRHVRLVIDRLPNGKLYIWPVIGSADEPSS